MKVTEENKLRTADSFGSGAFGASRDGGERIHRGVDIVAEKGDKIYAPFAGVISKYGFMYSGDIRWRYVEIVGEENICRIGYTDLDSAHFVGKKVGHEWFLGIAAGIEKKYPGITPHVHFELYDLERRLLNPTYFLKKKV